MCRMSAPPPEPPCGRHVFLADLTQPANPDVTTADQAIVTSCRHRPTRKPSACT